MSFEASVARILSVHSPKNCDSVLSQSVREQSVPTITSPTCNRKTLKAVRQRPLTYQTLVEQILHTVGELEHSLVQDHQHDYKLHMALIKQREKVTNLQSSLENEKKRNDRLVQLIQGADSTSSTDEDVHTFGHKIQRVPVGATVGGSGIGSSDFVSIDAYESISPLLMQQRYDELSISYKKCRRQLIKREKALTRYRCDKEELQAKHDHLIDEYRSLQQRFEELCCRCLSLQSKRQLKLQKLQDVLNCASNCIFDAQYLMDNYVTNNTNACSITGIQKPIHDFRQNLQSFIRLLQQCDWLQQHMRIKCTE